MLSGPGQQIFLSFFLSVWFLKNSGEKKGEMRACLVAVLETKVFCFQNSETGFVTVALRLGTCFKTRNG
jgi:hypothetical protein